MFFFSLLLYHKENVSCAWAFVYVGVKFNLRIAVFMLKQPSSLKTWKDTESQT